MNFGNAAFVTTGRAPTITLNTWQLVGFTAYISANKKTSEGTFFVDASWAQFYGLNIGTTMDTSTAALLRIGDATNSVSGSISAIRIMTPGGGVVRTSKLHTKTLILQKKVTFAHLQTSANSVPGPLLSLVLGLMFSAWARANVPQHVQTVRGQL